MLMSLVVSRWTSSCRLEVMTPSFQVDVLSLDDSMDGVSCPGVFLSSLFFFRFHLSPNSTEPFRHEQNTEDLEERTRSISLKGGENGERESQLME